MNKTMKIAIKRHIITPTVNMFYRSMFAMRRPCINSDARYMFAICAIFRNEARYMREWIEYHLLIGVDHIIPYNNFSTDDFMPILQPYIEKGVVTLTEWPHEHGQMECYMHCSANFGKSCRWIAFIDLDEYICPHEATDIKEWIKRYEKYPGVILYWLMFGTAGRLHPDPEKTLIEQYTTSWQEFRNTGKPIWNTAFPLEELFVHYLYGSVSIFGIKFKVPMVNESGSFVMYPDHHPLPRHNTIRINHYWSKSIEEYHDKMARGSAFSAKKNEIRRKVDFFLWHEHHAVRDDRVIFRFLTQLKMRLNGTDFNLHK